MTTKFSLAFAFMVLLIGFSACIEPVPDPSPDYKTIPMTLQKEDLPDGTVRLKWSKTKSFDFKEYWIVRSLGKDSVAYITKEPFVIPNSPVVPDVELMAKVMDIDSVSFVDSVTFFNQKVSYRLFSVLEGRVLSSNSVTVDKKVNAEEVNFLIDELVPIYERRQLMAIDRRTSNMHLFNTTAPISSINMSQFTNQNSEINYRIVSGLANDIEFTVPFTGSVNIRNFNTPTLSLFSNLNFFTSPVPNLGNSYILDSSNLIITAPARTNSQTTMNYFSALRTNTSVTALLSTRSFTLPIISINTPVLAVLKKNPFTNREAIGIVPISDKVRLHLLTWENKPTALGTINIVKEAEFDAATITQQPFIFSPDSKIFVTNTEGVVFDKNTLTKGASLKGKTGSNYLDYTFSEDGSRIYALRNAASNRSNNKVDVFKYPSLELEKSIPLATKPTRLVQFSSQIILFGRSPNLQTRTLVERITI